ncbi:hypothetical protein BGZ96_001547 [Linnemannia gamsii]|uniref:F-box domain-containing protein n=1 Tax=Linnemannia gamsii TaxID=64522 RepID=A0ABQ7K906_9FUNG|nr:hypothetical protein BGZ96_001547 [Linnemannia gamsii]
MSHSDTMVTTLIESCPHIVRMLRFSEHDDLTHDRCLDILWAYPGLVEFAFCYSEDMTPQIEATGIGLQELVGIQWASGEWLEELQVPIGSPEFFSLSIDEQDVWDRAVKEERIKEEKDRPEAQQQRRIDVGRVHVMKPHAISIFEIPLILSLICKLLDPVDLGNCRQTCSLWEQLFGLYVWKDVNLCSNGMSSVEARDGARRNADWIRSLEINLYDTLFECPTTICTQFSRLTCATNNTEISPSAVKAGIPDYAKKLIIQNSCLQTLAIDIIKDADKCIRQPLLSYLKDLKHLKSLELRIEGMFNVAIVEAIVRRCSVSVVSFAIKIKAFTGSGAADAPELLVIEHVTDLDLPAWRPLTNPTRLTFAVYYHN